MLLSAPHKLSVEFSLESSWVACDRGGAEGITEHATHHAPFGRRGHVASAVARACFPVLCPCLFPSGIHHHLRLRFRSRTIDGRFAHRVLSYDGAQFFLEWIICARLLHAVLRLRLILLVSLLQRESPKTRVRVPRMRRRRSPTVSTTSFTGLHGSVELYKLIAIYSSVVIGISRGECRFEVCFRWHRRRLLSICYGFLSGFLHQLLHAYAECREIQFWCFCLNASSPETFDGSSFLLRRERHFSDRRGE